MFNQKKKHSKSKRKQKSKNFYCFFILDNLICHFFFHFSIDNLNTRTHTKKHSLSIGFIFEFFSPTPFNPTLTSFTTRLTWPQFSSFLPILFEIERTNQPFFFVCWKRKFSIGEENFFLLFFHLFAYLPLIRFGNISLHLISVVSNECEWDHRHLRMIKSESCFATIESKLQQAASETILFENATFFLRCTP